MRIEPDHPRQTTDNAILRELNSLRENQSRILTMVDALQQEVRAIRSGNAPVEKPVVPVFSSHHQQQAISASGSSVLESEQKYKDLKKKLLMANLKIMELQRKNEKSEKQ